MEKSEGEKPIIPDHDIFKPIPLPGVAVLPQTQPPPYSGAASVIDVPEYLVNSAVDGITDDNFKTFSFDEYTIRRSFIAKVYSLILLQMGVTAAFVCWFMFHDPTKFYVRHNLWVMYMALGIYLVTVVSMACCKAPRRQVPYNYIFLFLFTVGLSVLVGIVTTTFDKSEVLIAFGITLAIVLSLTLFAFQTKIDFTLLSGSLLVIFLVLILFGITAVMVQSPTMYLLYCGLGVVFFGIHLVYDTQLIIGGNHSLKISPEEYVFAALTIYLDIMNIFVRILRLMR